MRYREKKTKKVKQEKKLYQTEICPPLFSILGGCSNLLLREADCSILREQPVPVDSQRSWMIFPASIKSAVLPSLFSSFYPCSLQGRESAVDQGKDRIVFPRYSFPSQFFLLFLDCRQNSAASLKDLIFFLT